MGNSGRIWRIPRTMLTICLITLGDPATLTGKITYAKPVLAELGIPIPTA